jgi:GTPase SAR1 family protein
MKTLNHYILVTGLMSSGKSTIINEYIRNFPWREFQKPPIEVKFQGLEFDLSDSAFALERQSCTQVAIWIT